MDSTRSNSPIKQTAARPPPIERARSDSTSPIKQRAARPPPISRRAKSDSTSPIKQRAARPAPIARARSDSTSPLKQRAARPPPVARAKSDSTSPLKQRAASMMYSLSLRNVTKKDRSRSTSPIKQRTASPPPPPRTIKVSFGGTTFHEDNSPDGTSSLDQDWWRDAELNEAFEADMEAAANERRSNSYEKRGLDCYVLKNAHKVNAQKYVQSVVRQNKKLHRPSLFGAIKPADHPEEELFKYSRKQTKPQAANATKIAEKHQVAAMIIYKEFMDNVKSGKIAYPGAQVIKEAAAKQQEESKPLNRCIST